MSEADLFSRASIQEDAMSRYRDDRDDYGGGRSPRGRGDYEEDERRAGRDDYGRARGGIGVGGGGRSYRDEYRPDEMSYAPDRERYLGGGGGGGRDYDDYGRARDYRREDYSRPDYPAGGGRDDYERRDYERATRDDYERPAERGAAEDRDHRSLWEQGRDLISGRQPPPGREQRGASRSHVRCRDIMTRDVTVAMRETTLEEVARMMRDEDTGVIPVVEHPGATPAQAAPADAAAPTGGTATTTAIVAAPAANVDVSVAGTSQGERKAYAASPGNGRLVGLITDRDVVVRAIAEGKDPRTTRAEEIMTTDVHTAQPNDRVIEAIRKMGDKQVRRIPVVDRDQILRGIISMADVALETNDDRELAEALEEISSGSSFWNRIFG